jgi:hypothetical protein
MSMDKAIRSACLIGTESQRANIRKHLRKHRTKTPPEEGLDILAEARILASNCNLGGKELKALLVWHLGPRCGISGKTVAQLQARWDEVKGEPPSPATQPNGDEEPLPHADVLARLRARLTETPVCFPAPAPVISAAAAGDVEEMSEAQLDAMIAVAAAQKERLLKKKAEAEQAAARAAAGPAE